MTIQHLLRGKTIAFDLDGTLVDTAPDLITSMNWAMNQAGHPVTPAHIVRNRIGRGAKALLQTALQYHQINVAPPQIEKMLQMFLAHYAKTSTENSIPFAGAVACLRALQAHGATLSVCTNKLEYLTLPILQKLELLPLFGGVFCPDNVPAKKPDAAHVLAAIAPVSPKNALMIGDSQPDVASAKAAGVGCILLAHGYSEIPVAELGAELVLPGFDGLEAAILHCFA
ncbi:Phosphoglycolate phosphatase [hydrothermal vent metagenome]|uniref:Phosphoglycolate phosphatase n=1 Tax=hydrothermal vent metagenome TaxID=652676 RepID=A0A3B0SA93_9ZZZZ